MFFTNIEKNKANKGLLVSGASRRNMVSKVSC